jgi:hypothetical protein
MVALVAIEISAMASFSTEKDKLSSKLDIFLISGMFKYDNIQLNENEQNMDYETFEKSGNFSDCPRGEMTEESFWYRQVWDWSQREVRKVYKKFSTVIVLYRNGKLGVCSALNPQK